MNQSSHVPPLILTKLHQPRVSQDLASRPRLLERLQSPPSLTLVVAPAGYGKTTLLSVWLGNSGLPSAWLSLDSQDSNLTAFVSYLIGKNATSSFYWCVNPNSGDTGGVLQNDWKTWNTDKVTLLQRLMK